MDQRTGIRDSAVRSLPRKAPSTRQYPRASDPSERDRVAGDVFRHLQRILGDDLEQRGNLRLRKTGYVCGTTLALFVADNEEIDPEAVDAIDALDVGAMYRGDEGAGGTWALLRVR